MQTYQDKENNFIEIFNPATGFYVRSGIIDEEGKDTGIDPFMRCFPNLLDIGIMGHCTSGLSGRCGVDCYQSGRTRRDPHMSLEDYKKIIRQCRGEVFQCALGGCGSPDEHPDFHRILIETRDNYIVPNYTTSGILVNKRIAKLTKKYCGAVAVSWYRQPFTYKAIDLFLEEGCITNIHYVLSQDSIDEATDRLCNNDFPKGINAVIFLLYKPVGQGTKDKVLRDKEKIKNFLLEVIKSHPFKIGFDSCCSPILVNYCPAVDIHSYDACEGSRYSAYIGPDLVMTPCSFDEHKKWGVSLRDHTIEEVWESSQFNNFRSILKNSCPECVNKGNCLGGCPIVDTNVCSRGERKNVGG